MNYRLEIQKLRLRSDKTENSEEKKTLLKEAIAIAENYSDYEECLNLYSQLICEEEEVDFRIDFLKQAIRIADTINDKEEGFYLREQLIEEETMYTSRCIDSFPAMVWMLDAVDNNPDVFREESILWQYKWLAVSAINNADVSYEQIERILEDLKNRLERNGYGLGAYYVPKIEWAISRGNIEEALQILAERDKYGRDEMSDCEACEQNLKIQVKLLAGNIDEALSDMEDMRIRKLSCAEVPYETYCYLAYFLNKAEHPEANIYFKKGLRKVESGTEIENLSRLISYASYHQPEIALELYEKYSHWQFEAEDRSNFYVSINFLNLFKQDKLLKMPRIKSAFPLYNPSGEYKSGDLYDYYFTIAKNLADKFDARNKTDNFKNILKTELRS